MDNASKALIMVGGVLITVMVISVAMYLITGARGVADASERRLMVSQIEGFNRFFVNYPPEITGLDVYNIIGKIEDISATASLPDVSYSGASKSDVEDTVNFTLKYKYTYSDNDGNGYIDFVNFIKIGG